MIGEAGTESSRPGPPDSPAENRDLGRFSLALTSLPGLGAIASVTLYALGMSRSAAQLREAHLDLGDTFSLVPWHDHFTAALAAFLNAGAAFVTVGVFIALLAYRWLRSKQDSASRARPPQEIFERIAERTTVVLGLMVIVGACLAVGLDWLTGAELALAAVVGIAAMRTIAALAEPMLARRPRSSVVICLMCSLAAATFLDTWAAAPRLPIARLEVANGTQMTGSLIAHTEGFWYLAQGINGTYVAIPDRQIIQAELSPGTEPVQHSLLHVLFS